jgi:hypothetical protein
MLNTDNRMSCSQRQRMHARTEEQQLMMILLLTLTKTLLKRLLALYNTVLSRQYVVHTALHACNTTLYSG